MLVVMVPAMYVVVVLVIIEGLVVRYQTEAILDILLGQDLYYSTHICPCSRGSVLGVRVCSYLCYSYHISPYLRCLILGMKGC
jgi:hypothetical protein